MATYFHGNTEIQSASSGQDGLQTLVLMNPTGYIPYSDTPPPNSSSSASGTGNFVFLNSPAATLAHHHHHAPPHQQQQQNQHFDMSGFHHGFLPQRVQYNVWTPPPETPSPSARDTPRSGTPLQQGLSLTLSSQQLRFGSPHAPQSGDDVRGVSVASSAVSGVTTGGAAGMQSVLLSSKYLRAAQELLEEVVNVGAGIGVDTGKKSDGGGGSKSVGESSGAAASGDGSGKRSSSAELTPAERQEVQMKKAKLIGMLDEVEQRYRQYHQQMQIVICSFEQAAGMGSARTYTALALQTISKQFRCLKDAIAGQIRVAGKCLGEETDGGAGSRLKFVDHHLRQQRALQQIGMIQHNAWRPQRGLPERSVSVLRAWLFEHFLHPYPKDSDKHMLAKQTGLTRSQVSNWFINARVRLWKPMVEEMYLEEIKENNGGQTTIGDDKVGNSSDGSKLSPTAVAIEPQGNNNDPSAPSSLVSPRPGGFSLVVSSELDGIALARNSPKKARCGEGDGDALSSPNAHLHNHRHLTVDVKADEDNDEDDNDDDENQVPMGRDGYSFMGAHQTNFIGGFGQYPIAEIGRPFDVATAAVDPFTPRYSSGGSDNSNGFSLTLGLPHHHLSLSGGPHHHQNGFVQAGPVIQLGGSGGGGIRRVDHLHHHHMGEVSDQFGAINASPHPHSSSAAVVAFDAINIQNPKRFAAQLLPDYVS